MLCPEAYAARGGVQAYSRRIAEILCDFGDRFGYGLKCVSYLDSAYDPLQHVRPVRYTHCVGSCGRKLGFVKTAVAGCMHDTRQTAVVTHIGQAPVAWALKTHGLIRGYVLVLHGLEAWCKLGSLRRRAAAGADRIVATTAYTAERFRSLNTIAERKLAIIPLSLPESDIEAPDAQDSGGSNFSILSAGRITTTDNYKGYDTLIDAVHVLRTRGLSATLDIVGSGDDVPRLIRRAENLGVSDAVKFPGAVSDSDLHRRFRECNVFALPSRAEGYGIVFLEAMRYGKPCIGGRHGGTPELINDGVDGYLVEHGNTAELANRLTILLERQDLRAEMGRRAFEKVRARHLYSRMRQQWFDLLSEITEDQNVRNCRCHNAA